MRLEALSRVLDRKLAQTYGFNKDAAVSTHVYGPRDQIHPIASTAGLIVKVASSVSPVWAGITALVQDTDFELLPRNALNGPEPQPYTDIRLLTSTTTSLFTVDVINPSTYIGGGDYRVQVTAIHGWPAVPMAIKLATIELAAIVAGESIFTTGRINEMDQVIDASAQARSILKSLYQVYSRFPVAVA